MRIRADIVRLIGQGLTNAAIARATGVSPSTVARARMGLRFTNAPRRPPTAEERLYAEALPTGLIRDFDRRRLPISPAQAAANRAALAAALRLVPAPATRKAS